MIYNCKLKRGNKISDIETCCEFQTQIVLLERDWFTLHSFSIISITGKISREDLIGRYVFQILAREINQPNKIILYVKLYKDDSHLQKIFKDEKTPII